MVLMTLLLERLKIFKDNMLKLDLGVWKLRIWLEKLTYGIDHKIRSNNAIAITNAVSRKASAIASLTSEFAALSENAVASLEDKFKENKSLRIENEMLKYRLQEIESSEHSTLTLSLSTPKSDLGWKPIHQTHRLQPLLEPHHRRKISSLNHPLLVL